MLSQKQGKPSRIYDGEYPLTGILKCPESDVGMVISRVIDTKKDGSKNKIAYYVCSNWKNKGTAACHSNMVRAEKANDFVYHQLERLFSNDKFFHEVIKRVNRKHRILKENALKEREAQSKEMEKKEIPQEAIRNILQNFSKVLSSSIDWTIRKRLLNLLISEITIDKRWNIDSIKQNYRMN